MFKYRVSFYARGKRQASDGLIFDTREEAESYGRELVESASTMDSTQWVHRFTIAKLYWP